MLKVLTRQRDKRRFLTMGLAATSGMLSLPLACAARQDCTRWAFLSDTHIHRDPQYRFRSFCTYENLQRVVDDIGEEMPEGLVITGDLARSRGSADAYENFKSLLAPIAKRRPIHLCIGNHDHREDFRTVFTDSAHGGAIENRHIVTAMAGPIRMIVLDTLLVVNTFPGMLGKLQRIWLETYLGASDETPTILFCHHAPRADLLDTRRLFEIISPVRKVKALVFGHSHRYEFSQRDGIHLVNLPATGYNFTAGQPVGWVEARLTGEGGEFTLHAVGGNTSQHGNTQALRWRE